MLDAQWSLMHDGHHWHPRTDSPLERRRALLQRKFGPTGAWDGAEAEQAGVLATLFIAVSGQQLEGIRSLLLARQVIMPLTPLARSVVEAAGHIFWLLDPKIAGLRDLSARFWMARLDDATRRVTTAKAVGNSAMLEALVKAKQQVREVDIPARFYKSEVIDYNGKLTIRNQSMPGLSGSLKYIAAGMGIEDWHTPMYAYLSDATHPTPYTALETVQPVEGSGDSDLRQFGSANLRREFMIYQAAVHAYQQMWLVVTAYYGLDVDPVVKVCDRVNHLPKPSDP